MGRYLELLGVAALTLGIGVTPLELAAVVPRMGRRGLSQPPR